MKSEGQIAAASEENAHKHQLTSKQISEQSAKIITFYDLAGHERYLKTTVLGVLLPISAHFFIKKNQQFLPAPSR